MVSFHPAGGWPAVEAVCAAAPLCVVVAAPVCAWAAFATAIIMMLANAATAAELLKSDTCFMTIPL